MPWLLYLGVGASIALTSAAGSWWVTSNSYALTIASIKNEQLQTDVTTANAALDAFTQKTAAINVAATGYQNGVAALNNKFAALSKDFKNAQAAKPLPVDCRPDDIRLHGLWNAIDAANGQQAKPAP